MEILWNFQGNFWNNLWKIVRKLVIFLEENCGGTPKKFWKHLEALENLSRGDLKINLALLLSLGGVVLKTDSKVSDLANLRFLVCKILVFLWFLKEGSSNFDFQEGFGNVSKNSCGFYFLWARHSTATCFPAIPPSLVTTSLLVISDLFSLVTAYLVVVLNVSCQFWI